MIRFQPKKDQHYWMINSRWEVKKSIYTGSHKAKGRVQAGNCFKSEAAAKYYLEWMRSGSPMTRFQHIKAALLGGVR